MSAVARPGEAKRMTTERHGYPIGFGNSSALEYAHDAVRGLLPEARLKLLHAMVRYCWVCGRVGLRNPAKSSWDCAHCGRAWSIKTWRDAPE